MLLFIEWCVISSVMAVCVTRLGLLYGIYRSVVAAILCAVYAFDFLSLRDYYTNADWYSLVVVVYAVLTILQLLGFVIYRKPVKQIYWMGLIDVACLGAIYYTIGYASMHVGFLFIVTIFVLNLVQTKKSSILLTLAAIISVVYLPFIDALLKSSGDENLVNSILLTIMFVVVSSLAKATVHRYQKLEEFNQAKIGELEQLREVAYSIMLDVEMGYLVLNNQFQIIFINKSAQTFLRGSERTWGDLKTLNPDFYENHIQARMGRVGMDKFSCLIDGVEYFASFQQINPTQEFYLVTLEDVRRIGERIHNLKLAALGQISASIAHEIRNPLTTISQAVMLVNGASADQMPRYCSMIKKQCDRINAIIQSTLDMAKNKELQPMRFSVYEAIRTLLSEDLLDLQAQVRVTGQPDLYIMFDEGHFRQILTNLIRNAVRHNNYERSEMVDVRIVGSINCKEVLVDVVDYGDGVPPHIVDKLFLPFFSTEKTGTGLGLYLVKNLCESNHSKIEYVKSDVGTCFRVSSIQLC